jgi:hypothetical protein
MNHQPIVYWRIRRHDDRIARQCDAVARIDMCGLAAVHAQDVSMGKDFSAVAHHRVGDSRQIF